MTIREKKAVSLAAVALLAFLFLQFLLLPMLEEGRRLKKNIATQEAQLAEMRQLAAVGQAGSGQGQSQSALTEALKQRGKDFTLFSFLEQAAALSEVKGHIEAMQPVQAGPEDGAAGTGGSAVDLQVQNVSLSQLLHFLDLVESPQNLVAVERLSIQGGGREGAFLNAALRVRTIEMADEAPTAPDGAKP